MTAETLQVRTLHDADEAAVLGLLTDALAGGPTGIRSAEFFQWKHRSSPFGRSPGLVAVDGDRVVGVRLFLRWELRLGNRTVRAVRAVDTATHPDYQRRGIFKRLTLSLLEHLEATEGVDLVFNTPNADSRPGYLRMGWQEVGTLPVRISPVRPVRFARGLGAARGANASGSASAVRSLGSAQVRHSSLPAAGEVLSDQESILSLLAASRVPEGLHTSRTPEFLRWRYAEPPGLDYRAVAVRRRGELVGLGLGRMRLRAGLTEFTLGDVIVRDGDVASARQVLRAARGSGADHVALHPAPGSALERAAAFSGYFVVPGQGIGLVANPRRGCPPVALSTSGWDLCLGDLEVF